MTAKFLHYLSADHHKKSCSLMLSLILRREKF